jgi:hypothetical protein
MRQAARVTATVLGLTAGGAGIEHGVFEILQGNVRPASLMFSSMGAPCVPAQSWNACEPALTVIPNLLVTGVISILLSLAVLAWSAFFIQRKRGGLMLLLLCLPLLLFGCGIFPPLIGIIAGAIGTRIHVPPPPAHPSNGPRVLGALWPWSLALYVAWVLGQWVIGYFFNDWLLAHGYVVIVMVLGTLLLTAVATVARDRLAATRLGPQPGSKASPALPGQSAGGTKG